MAAYRFYNPAPVMLDQDGLKPLAGGSVTFYEIGTTTEKDTWSDPDLSVLNPNPIALDADGRLHTDVFLDGSYTVLIEGLDGTTLTRDIPGPDAGQTIPAPTAGWFLTSPDGVNLAWAQILQLPDPTGQSGKVLSTDGSNFIWISPAETPEPADPDVVVAANSFQAGVSSDATKYLQQWGTGSSTASGGKTATATITFPKPFAEAPNVGIVPTTASACSAANLIPSWAVTNVSAAGFTVTFSTVTGGTSADDFSKSNILSPVTFMWLATGTIEVEE